MVLTESTYQSFRRIDLPFDGHTLTVVFPHKAEKRRRWLWRAEFLGAFDTVDVAMLERGWHLIYYSISDMYGCPEAVRLMDGCYRHVVQEYGLHSRTVLLGFSRGGLYSVSFAAAYPERTAALYLDAPVLDIFSWPCKAGSPYEQERRQCLSWYRLAETDTDTPDNPLHKLDALAESRIPLALVVGLADRDVSYADNGGQLAALYARAGAPLYLHGKPGCAHHPHSLTDPTPIADFLDWETAEN